MLQRLSTAIACGTLSDPPKRPCCPNRATTCSVSRFRIHVMIGAVNHVEEPLLRIGGQREA
jgi:hypothetical protein